jgi:hypothetical protein
LLDLTEHFNALLADSWQGYPSNTLAGLPAGLQEFAGIRFDVRGLIQVRGFGLPVEFPKKVEGIKVNQRCGRIHFLHATAFWHRPGTKVASYIIHYADSQVREIPLVYGEQIADWWFDPRKPAELTDAKVAWTGENEAAKSHGKAIRLYQSNWENPLRDVEVATISFLSSLTQAAPFLIAITLE